MQHALRSALLDPARLASLAASRLLDTPAEPAFDRLTALAARCTGAPVALLSLVDAGRQFFKSAHGLPASLAGLRETPLSHCLCQYEVASGEPLVIADTRHDLRSRDNGAVRELGVAAYAGVPLRAPGGHVLGSLCVLDFAPRAWDDGAVEALVHLAEAAATEIALRRELAERTRAETALRESERFAGLLVEASPDCVKVIDREGRVERMNAQGCRLMEIDDPAAVCGADWPSLWPCEGQDEARGALRAALAGETARFTGFCPSAKGTPRWWEVMAAPVRDVAGAIVRVLVVSRDVTARQEAERRLQRSEAQFRALIEHISELISVLDADGHIRYANPAYARVLGHAPGEALGMLAFELVHPDDRARTIALFEQALREPGSVVSGEYRVRRKDGEWRTLWSTAQSLLHEPSVAGVVVNSRDVTESRRAEAELRESEARLAEAQAMAHIGSWTVDVDTGVVWWSDELYRLFQRDPRDGALSPEDFLAALHPDDRERVRREMYCEPGAPPHFVLEYRVPQRDGSVRILREHGERRYDADGRMCRVAGTAQDVTAEVAAESALRASEARFRELAEGAPLGIFLADGAGSVLYANPHLASILGCSVDAIRAHGWADMIHPDDRERIGAAYAAFFADASIASRRDELRVVRADGAVRWIVVESARALASDGIAGAFVGAVTDVTEQRAAEEALRASEERFRGLVESAHEGVWALDTSGRTSYVNRRMAEMLGHSVAEMMGRSLLDFMEPEQALEARTLLARREQGIAELHEFVFRRADGAPLVTRLSSSPLRDASGAFAGALALVSDVTRKREAEQALRESEARLRLALDVAGVVVWERDLRTERLRDVALPRAQAPATLRADAMGDYAGFLARVHPDDRERVARLNGDAVASCGEFAVEFRTAEAEGVTRWNRTVARVLADADGVPARMIGVSQDVTAQRTLEAQLRQAQKMEAVGRLAGGVAHDFNNLLMVMSAGALFARSALPPDAPARQDLADVDAAVSRAAALTRQLLAFSRQQVLRLERLELNRVVANVERMLSRVIGEDIRLVTDLARDLAPVRADTGQLEQVLMNLAVNARDAMPAGGTLTLATANVRVGAGGEARFPGLQPGDYVALRVRDTGMGMDAATQARIFEPFFTTKEPGRGTGLGLATVYGIVQQSGGHVYVESAPGAGTTLTVVLPAAEDAPATHELPEAAPAIQRGTETILLVEDEPTVRSSVRRMLERAGYRVLEARHGGDALALAERHDGAIDLVLTDVVMPEIGALPLVERLRARWPRMRVLLMSGYSADLVDRAGGPAHELVLLAKPFAADVLLRHVRELLDA
jgi:PAS domain S-box-containing protein